MDEKALIKALKIGKIKGAAVDVYEREPEVNKELLGMENVILTPHTASNTEETWKKWQKWWQRIISLHLKGENQNISLTQRSWNKIKSNPF